VGRSRAAALILLLGCTEAVEPEGTPPPVDEERFEAEVLEVTDGDTIRVLLGGEVERVRYIGIDTPETSRSPSGAERFGEEASAENRRLVEGRTVELAFDIGERDRYGRLLAYVYLRDGTFVNAELVRNGFATVMTIAPNVRHASLFRELEAEARSAGRGLWAESE